MQYVEHIAIRLSIKMSQSQTAVDLVLLSLKFSATRVHKNIYNVCCHKDTVKRVDWWVIDQFYVTL